MRSARPLRVRDKREWIVRAIDGKDVLYIGCVDDNPENLRKHQTLHEFLAARAGSLLGVYRSDQQAAMLRGLGLHAVQANVEAMDLGKTFDVIVAADNIEHLSNPGRFLASAARHLSREGSFVVSTPNPTSLVRILELLAYRRTKANVEHAGWYTGQVLNQLAKRHGLRVTAEVFIDEMEQYHRIGSDRPMGVGKRTATRIVVGLNRVLCPMLPQLSEAFGFVLQRSDDGTSPRHGH